ncbi:MAG: 23S rRNA (pseudouridine(1915)-N(3))-methyltransferase RlmH, partial [Candidatus Zixiibacteriota bacterium]
MVKIKVIAVGKTKEDWIKEGIQHYLKLLKRYAEVNLVEIKEEKVTSSFSTKSALEKEAGRILDRLKQTDWCIALDVKGEYRSSEDFANFFEINLNQGYKEFTFIIGGPLGISPKVLESCPVRLSLSPMTFTHEMSRVILL